MLEHGQQQQTQFAMQVLSDFCFLPARAAAHHRNAPPVDLGGCFFFLCVLLLLTIRFLALLPSTVGFFAVFLPNGIVLTLFLLADFFLSILLLNGIVLAILLLTRCLAVLLSKLFVCRLRSIISLSVLTRTAFTKNPAAAVSGAAATATATIRNAAGSTTAAQDATATCDGTAAR